MQRADVIIIGSGQGGVPLAHAYAQDGRDVVLFERAQFGGTCVNYGCLPSKAFLASAHVAARARNATELGIHAQVRVDFPAVMAHARSVIHNSQTNIKQGLQDAGVRLVEATASFKNEQTVQGGGIEIQAETIVVDTGKSAAVPPIEGLDRVDFYTYEDFWEIDSLPQRTLIIGGGYVGVELGQGLARLGSRVTIVERSSRLIEREEEDVSQVIAEALAADGIDLLFNSEVSAVHNKGGSISAQLSNGRTVEVDALLVATGRKPNTEALNAEAAGIKLDKRGHIEVDAHFASTNPHVYAIGDVTGQPAFTHVSWEDYRRLYTILHGGERRQRDRVLGYVFFTEPQVGRAGMTLDQAKEDGIDAKAAQMPLSRVTRSHLTGRDEGFYRMVIDADTDKIVGATLVGPQAGELIHVFIAHMQAGSTWQVLEQSVHVHPTYAEGLPVLARQFKD